MDHVNEAEAHATLCLDINGQVEVVILSAELLVHELHELCLAELDGDILDHQRRLRQYLVVSFLRGIQDPFKVNLVVLWPDKLLLLLGGLVGLVELL